jgi:hypothetical protein
MGESDAIMTAPPSIGHERALGFAPLFQLRFEAWRVENPAPERPKLRA